LAFIEIKGRRIDLRNGRVVQDGKERYLAPRLLALLTFFVDHRGEVLSRDRIVEAVWGHLDAATDDSVNVAVSGLRRELGDTRRPHAVLTAVPRRGYRLVPEAVRLVDASTPPDAAESASPATPPATWTTGVRRAPIALVAVAAIALAWLTTGAFRNSNSERGETPPMASANASLWSNPMGMQRPSVVVLPFLDMSSGSDHQFFADGLVDRITHMLAQSKDLEVVARTSAFAFRNSDATIREVADRLQVDAVLEGSVQRSDDTVRVLAQLIDTETEAHLWSRTYDRPVDDLFDVQDDIANLVSRTLSDTLLTDTVTAHPDNQEVHDLITRGKFAMDQFTLESATRARELFEQALAIDPDNIEALVLIGDAIGMQRSQGPMRTAADEQHGSEPYLQRAREIHPEHPLVVRAVGDWHFRYGRSDEAIASYRQAIALNPNDPVAHRHLGRILFRTERFEEAIEPLQQAVRLDPFSGVANVWLADAFWAIGRAEEAMFRLRRIIRDQPEFPQAHDRLATYLVQTGESGEAMRHVYHQRTLDPDSPFRWFRVCEFYLQLGDADSARRCADELEATHDLPLRMPYLRQIIAGFEGDQATKRQHLEHIYSLGNRDPLTKMLYAQALAVDDCPAAMNVLEDSFPALFEPEPTMTPVLFMPAVTTWHCLTQAGETRRAAVLVERIAEAVERMRAEKGPWLVVGYERASVLAMRGDHDAALEELEQLVDGGWRYYWWELDTLPQFALLADRPRFKALVERLERGVAEQREYFEAHRDEPLI
jgi:TolB-like protein/tetratricopeptide (TPR) repeat protein/DNA-binding winged helix-turn-helix (wHTH) protein